MALTIALLPYLESWKLRHGQNAAQLAAYLGIPVDTLPQLADERIPGEVTTGWRAPGSSEYSGPGTVTEAGVRDVADRYGIDLDRLYDVLLTEMRPATGGAGGATG